jgi:hypothetical protein
MLSGVGRARGLPLPFAFYPAWQQQVTKNDCEAESRNRAKYGEGGWTVRSAFYSRNSHTARESSPTPAAKRLSPTNRKGVTH